MEENQTNEEQEKTPPKGNPMIWIAIVAAVVIVGIVFFSRGNKNNSATPAQTAPVNTPASSTTIDDQNVKVFEVSGKPFEFSVKEIKVKKGDKVRINFTSTQGMHDWVVDEFNAKTKVIQAGQSDSVEFLADKTGTFEYYCSMPTHRQQGMVGKLIVE
jgi:cytochrome c oxidase subunit II